MTYLHDRARLFTAMLSIWTFAGCSPTVDVPSSGSGPTGGTDAEEDDDGEGGGAESDDDPSGDPLTTGDPDPTVPDPIVCNPADIDEPNDLEELATVLPYITDDDADGGLVESILAGDRDTDWFAYLGTDVAFAIVDPAGDLAADMRLRLCLYAECAEGPTKVAQCMNSSYDETPELRRGCCNTGEHALVGIDVTCSNDDDSAYIFMRVDRGHADLCVPYELDYHY